MIAMIQRDIAMYYFRYDLHACMTCMYVCIYIKAVSEGKGKNAVMDWEAIHGLMEDAIYGGRIDNYYDLRVLRAYLRCGIY